MKVWPSSWKGRTFSGNAQTSVAYILTEDEIGRVYRTIPAASNIDKDGKKVREDICEILKVDSIDHPKAKRALDMLKRVGFIEHAQPRGGRLNGPRWQRT